MKLCGHWGRLTALLVLLHLRSAISQAELQGVQSSHKCYEEHTDPRYSDQRVCIFENLVVHNNTIYYVSSEVKELPKVVISWEKKYEGDQLLRITVVRPEQLPRVQGQVKVVKEAGLFHQQHPKNYYHLFTEIAPTVHYTVCKFLQRCQYQKHDQLRLYWVNEKRPEVPDSMSYSMPEGIKDLFRCMTPHDVLNIYDVTAVGGETLLLKKAVSGLPLRSRFYHQKKTEWRERWQDPPPLEFMQSYRQRVADCLDYDFVNAVAPTDPIRITFVNRHYDDGRHILNVERLRDQLRGLEEVKSKKAVVEVVYLEGTLRQQAEIIWGTSIYLWAHGAAMAQTFFLPRGAQAIEIVQWVVKDPIDQHIWVQGIRTAFNLNITLDVLVNNDPTKVFFNYDIIRKPGSQYHRFNHTEKVQLLEDLKCPEMDYANGMECFGWFHWGMSLKLDWDLLRPKFLQAFSRLQQAVAGLPPAPARPAPPLALLAQPVEKPSQRIVPRNH